MFVIFIVMKRIGRIIYLLYHYHKHKTIQGLKILIFMGLYHISRSSKIYKIK